MNPSAGETRPGPWVRILVALWNPVPAMRATVANPVLLPPYLVWMAVALVAAVAVFPHSWELTRELVAGQMAARVPREQLPAALAGARTSAMVAAAVGSLVMPWVVGVLLAVVLALCGSLMARPAGFKRYMALAAVAQGPNLLGSLLKIPLMLQATSLVSLARVSFSPLVFFPSVQVGSLAHAVLAGLDLFALWSLVLLVTGFALAQDTRPGRVWWVGALIWLGSVGLNVIATLFQNPSALG